ncbi:MAG TPA: type II toxin-antitoxin system RelE/ParE family toxin, partial [Burkholderiaceae bacterium]|nr:type II toxin-antitoxin system RelE/ParE family toxin [Burkholderiaceae bacterium]
MGVPRLYRRLWKIWTPEVVRNLIPLEMRCTEWYSFVMRRVFKTRTFTGSMKKAGLTDAALCAAVEEMSQGLIDADLGGYVVKKRVALSGQGKRGGARTIVATKMAGRWLPVKFWRYVMATTKRNSRILDEMHETARGLHSAGLISKRRMGEFEALCNL